MQSFNETPHKDMAMKSLYHGDNGSQEFWENEEYLVMRLHQEKWWSINQKCRKGRKLGFAFVEYVRSAQEAADKLNMKLDPTKVYRRHGKGFRLVDAE